MLVHRLRRWTNIKTTLMEAMEGRGYHMACLRVRASHWSARLCLCCPFHDHLLVIQDATSSPQALRLNSYLTLGHCTMLREVLLIYMCSI